jgi:hypothetical protein
MCKIVGDGQRFRDASYSEGPGFKSQPGDRLFWLKCFVIFLSPPRQMLGSYLKSWPWPLRSAPFPIHHSLITPSFDDALSKVTEKAKTNKKKSLRRSDDGGSKHLWNVYQLLWDWNSDGEHNSSENGRSCVRRFVRYHSVTVTSILPHLMKHFWSVYNGILTVKSPCSGQKKCIIHSCYI